MTIKCNIIFKKYSTAISNRAHQISGGFIPMTSKVVFITTMVFFGSLCLKPAISSAADVVRKSTVNSSSTIFSPDIQDAYDDPATVDTDELLCHDGIYINPNTGMLTRKFDKPLDIKLSGGYDAGLNFVTGRTTIYGNIDISGGKVTVSNIALTSCVDCSPCASYLSSADCAYNAACAWDSANNICVGPCVYSEWSEPSPCTAACNGGTQQSTRTVIYPGPAFCTAPLVKIESCNTTPCACEQLKDPLTCTHLSCEWWDGSCRPPGSGGVSCSDLDEDQCVAEEASCLWVGVCISIE
jgi:hypothetical protein